MGFSSLLGNAQLKENLRQSLKKGNISHFYLISGAQGSGKRTLAHLLAAAILCPNEDKPCLTCPVCRRVMSDSHPDFITVTDSEHKNVAVKLVREMREDVFVRPNEAEHKIYFIPQELGIEGQNALLKILEEPPKYGVFLLLTDNPDKLLPTVRSRCTQLKLLPLPRDVLLAQLKKDDPARSAEDLEAAVLRSGGFLGQAREFLAQAQHTQPQTATLVAAFAQRDALALVQTLAPMEKWKRDALVEILSAWIEIFEGALVARMSGVPTGALSRSIATARASNDILDALHKLQKALEYAQGNVSTGAICGWLAWALR